LLLKVLYLYYEAIEIVMSKYESFFLNNWSNKDSVIADFEGVYYNEDLTPEMAAKYANVEVLMAPTIWVMPLFCFGIPMTMLFTKFQRVTARALG